MLFFPSGEFNTETAFPQANFVMVSEYMSCESFFLIVDEGPIHTPQIRKDDLPVFLSNLTVASSQ
jgi:hypothetical protein